MDKPLTNQYDDIIQSESIAAIVMRQFLKPVEGDHAVIFPPTYANIGYNIDTFDQGAEIRNVCTIDSVGSQANRMEPLFKKKPYQELIPQITIELRKPAPKGQDKGELIDTINLLDAGHRIADAVVRFSNAADEISSAFQKIPNDATRMAKIAPTSLVFGCWDSRGSSIKLPRIVRSTIMAYNIYKLKRSAQYIPATERYEEALEKISENERKKFADAGMGHVPSTENPGGVLLGQDSQVRKDVVLSLSALRALRADDDENTKKLRRYIFGLSLVAITAPQELLLRMGCELTSDPQRQPKMEKVNCDGTRETITVSHADALTFAQAAKDEFGIGESKTFVFDPRKANEELKKLSTKGKKAEEKSS